MLVYQNIFSEFIVKLLTMKLIITLKLYNNLEYV
jgi:hypothetical protein